MRVLHLTPEMPLWPGGNGGQTRQFHLFRGLAERGHDVTIVAPYTAEQERGAAQLEAAGIRFEGVRRPPSRVRESLAALAREPRLVPRALSRPLLAWQVDVFWSALRPIARRLAAEGPDVVTVEHDNAAAWAADLGADMPAVLVLQNVGPGYYEARTRAARGPARAALALEAVRFRRHDRRHLGRYAALIAMSEPDREDIRQLAPVPVEVVPNGVASDEMRTSGPPAADNTLLFTGTMGHPPNAEGIVWFADEVWPRIRAACPDARLRVVGAGPPPRVMRLGERPGIEVTGPVPSMVPYFEEATAVVVPLLSGGGTRLKILEAFSAERPVVSTAMGAEGIELEPGRHALIEDDPARFADAAVSLLQDEEARRRLAAAGRALAEERYDWRFLAGELERVLLGVVERRGAPAPR